MTIDLFDRPPPPVCLQFYETPDDDDDDDGSPLSSNPIFPHVYLFFFTFPPISFNSLVAFSFFLCSYNFYSFVILFFLLQAPLCAAGNESALLVFFVTRMPLQTERTRACATLAGLPHPHARP